MKLSLIYLLIWIQPVIHVRIEQVHLALDCPTLLGLLLFQWPPNHRDYLIAVSDPDRLAEHSPILESPDAASEAADSLEDCGSISARSPMALLAETLDQKLVLREQVSEAADKQPEAAELAADSSYLTPLQLLLRICKQAVGLQSLALNNDLIRRRQ